MKRKLIAAFLVGAVSMSSFNVFASVGRKAIEVIYNNLKVFADGREVKMPVGIEPFMLNGTTYLPVRAVSEALGKEIDYDNKTGSIYIGEKPSGKIGMHELEEFSGLSFLTDSKDSDKWATHGSIINRQKEIKFFNALSFDPYLIPTHSEYLLGGKYSTLTAKLVAIDSRFEPVKLEIYTVIDGKNVSLGIFENKPGEEPIDIALDITGVDRLVFKKLEGYPTIYNAELHPNK